MKRVLAAGLMMVLAISLAAASIRADFSDSESTEDNLLQAGSLDLRLADFDEFFGIRGDSVVETWYYRALYPAGMAPGDTLDGTVYLTNVGSTEATSLDILCSIRNVEVGNDTDAENMAENRILIDLGLGIDNDRDGLVDEDDADGVDNDGDGLVDEDPNPLTSGAISPLAGRGVYDKDTVMVILSMTYQNSPPLINIVWDDGASWNLAHIDDVDGDGVITLYDFKKHGVLGLPPPESGVSNFYMKVRFGEASIDLNEYQGDSTQMVLVFALFQ